MRIDIITVVPELMESPFKVSMLKRAIEKGLAEIHFHNVRDYSTNNYKQIDDTQYGGGAGMVMMVEPLDKCISQLKSERNYDEIIYLTPDGKTLNQKIANSLSLKENLILICGHYKGIDQRGFTCDDGDFHRGFCPYRRGAGGMCSCGFCGQTITRCSE